MREEAVDHRNKGYLAHKSGDLDTAMAYYQKAISLDSYYATAHNDLGVLYEEKGWFERAEQEYKKTLEINPNYPNTHSNLALLYEKLGQREKAIFHWAKRSEVGRPNDPWTQRAKERLMRFPPEEVERIRTTGLIEEMVQEKEQQIEEDAALASKLREQGLAYYKKGEYGKALTAFEQALKYTPRDNELARLREETESKAREVNMKGHFNRGIEYYQQRDYTRAREEFDKVIELLPGEKKGGISH